MSVRVGWARSKAAGGARLLSMDNPTADTQGSPDSSPAREREVVAQMLLAATAAMAAEQDPETALQEACRSLVEASAHLRAAWVYILRGDTFHGLHGAGELPDGLLQADDLNALTDALARYPLNPNKQLVCFIFRGLETHGCFGIAADRSDYVEWVGETPFHLFANLAGSLIAQSRLRARLREQAEFDELTGVLNRGALQDVLARVHADAQRTGMSYAVMLSDIDNFKAINDQHGHQTGDEVLAQVTRCMQAGLRQGDWLGRWGGEEFLALLPRIEADEAVEIADRLRQQVAAATFATDYTEFRVTLSGGVACHPLDAIDTQSLLSIADAALYEAKDAGRNRVQRATRRGRRLYTLAARIEEGLRAGRIRPAYQPIVDLRDGHIVGEEALARLISRGRKVMVAADFIEVASLRHLIHHIDEHIFGCALQHCRQRVEQGLPRLQFVNISAGTLRHPERIAAMATAMHNAGEACSGTTLSEGPLVVEITERDFLYPEQAAQMLAPLLACGARLAIDDFGSGYSSFQYLVELPVEFVKIEGSIVRKAVTDTKARAVLRGIRDVARESGARTLAEGVEDAATAELVRELGIDWVQGYYFGVPELPAA